MMKNSQKFSRNKAKIKLPVRIYYFTQIISFVSITLLTILLIRFNIHEKKLLEKGKMDQEMITLMTAYLTDRTDHFLAGKPDIEGAVIYEVNGTTLFSHGTISRDPRIHDYDKTKIIYTDSKNNLLLSNLEINLQKDFPPERKHYLNNKFTEDDIVFHIEKRDPRYFRGFKGLIYIQGIIHFFTLLIFLQAHRFFRRSSIMKEQLESQENLVILGSALRTLTHEMKNPLAAIRLQSGFINRVYPKELEEETSVINSEVERLSRLMETVRDYLKDPVGNQESLEIAPLMHSVRKRYPAEINWKIPDSRFCITIDPDKFRSIMDNLLNNALESGSETDRITVEISLTKRLVYVSVRDEGTGIPEDIKKRLFDPFFTTKSRGSGVGLMITRRFLEAAQGNIYVESTEKKMTEVVFRLPIGNRRKKQ